LLRGVTIIRRHVPNPKTVLKIHEIRGNVTRGSEIRGNITRGNEIRGNVTRKNKIRVNMTRGNEIQDNVISGKRNSRKRVFGQMCFRKNGPRGNSTRGNKIRDNVTNLWQQSSATPDTVMHFMLLSIIYVILPIYSTHELRNLFLRFFERVYFVSFTIRKHSERDYNKHVQSS
jgi:hypothetical protein